MKRLLTVFVILISVFSINAQQKDTAKYELEQVTVSATRYAEPVMEIPYAVSILTLKDFQNLKGYGLDEVMLKVPGVLAQSRAGNQDTRLIIRGFGARGSGDRSNSGTSRGIRIMLDGIPETEPDGRTSFDNIDLAVANNIEVIRSNASALWGNASGGVINISTVPDFDDHFVKAQALAGSFGLSKYTIQAGAEIGTGMVYGTFTQNNFDGWREHSSSYRSMFNLGLISNLAKATKLGVHLTAVSNVFHIPGPLTDSLYNANPEAANPTYLKRDERRFNRLGRIGVTLDHAFDSMNEISAMAYVNPKYLQRSERGTFRDFTRYHFGGNFIYKNYYNFSSYVQNKFLAGADKAYQDGAILFYKLTPANQRGALDTDKREGADNTGAFIQDELIINNQLSILLGGRYDNVTYYSEDYIDASLGLQNKSFEKFTPKAGITYRFTPLISIYANLGGGVEVPAGNETDPAGTFGLDTIYAINPLLDPIESTTYEFGTKQLYSFNGGFLSAVSLDLAMYYIKIKNDIIPYRGGRFYFTAGKSHRMGAELSTQIYLDYGITLEGSLTLSNNEYDTYLVDSVHYGSTGYADYSGNKVAGIPDMFYYAGVTYEPEFLPGLYVNFSTNGIDKYFVDDANKTEVPSFNLINASIGLNKPVYIGNYFNVRGFFSVNNIADTKYAASAFINPDSIGYLEPGLPRNFTFSLIIGI